MVSLLCYLLCTTKFLLDHLQSPDLQLASATDLVESVITSLSEKCNAKPWNEIWDKAQALSTKTGIHVQVRPERRQAQPSCHLQGFVAEAQTGKRPPLTSSDDIRKHCYYPVIDRLVSELKRRFSPESCGVLQGTSALNPKRKTSLEMEHLSPMAEHYGVRNDNLSAELPQV